MIDDTNPSQNPTIAAPIAWQAIFALALLQGANIFGFMAYYYAQPKVLEQFGYTGEFWIVFLVIAQGVIAILMNPLMGKIADKYKTEENKIFNVVGLGVNLAGLVFVVVAIGTTQYPGSLFYNIVRPLVPILVVCWLIAMNIFASPAMSLIRAYAPGERIAEAHAAFAIITLLLFLISPYLGHFLDNLSLPIIFLVGGMLLYSAYRLLVRVSPKVEAVALESSSESTVMQNLLIVFLMGFIVNIVMRIPLAAMPILLSPSLEPLGLTANSASTIAFIISIFVSIPISQWMKRGQPKILMITICTAIFLFILSIYCSHLVMGICLIILLGLTTAFLEVNAVPYVFTKVNSGNSGLGVGSFMSGSAMATLGLMLYINDDVQVLLDYFWN